MSPGGAQRIEPGLASCKANTHTCCTIALVLELFFVGVCSETFRWCQHFSSLPDPSLSLPQGPALGLGFVLGLGLILYRSANEGAPFLPQPCSLSLLPKPMPKTLSVSAGLGI